MAISSGFFNSVSGDRLYNAEQMTLYFEGLISNGVYESIGDKLQVTAGEGMTVTVGTGRAMIKSHWIKNDAAISLTIDAASAQYNRIDAVVLQYNATARSINLIVRKGDETTGVPNAPQYIRTNDIYELWLATVRVMKNTTAITQDMIVDFRMSALCGFVTGLIKQVDTSTLYDQWQAAYENYYAQTTAALDAYFEAKRAEYETWFASLTQELRVDTTLKSYYNTVAVSGSATSSVMIGISEYDSNADIFFAYANGVYLVGGIDYTVSGTGETAKINLTKPLTGTNAVNFVVIKPVIGENTSGSIVGNALASVTNVPTLAAGNATREDI